MVICAINTPLPGEKLLPDANILPRKKDHPSIANGRRTGR